MKKLLLLLLAAVMTLSLMACGGENNATEGAVNSTGDDSTTSTTEAPSTETTEPQMPDFDASAAAAILGEWRLEASLSGEDMGIENFDAELVLPMTLVLADGGIYGIRYISDELEESVALFNQALSAYAVEAWYTDLAEQGLEGETADTAFKETYGMTIQEYCDQYIADMNLAKNISQIEATGVYSVEGDKLYTSNSGGSDFETNTFTISGDTLTLLDTDDPESWAIMGVRFPIELTRYEAE